MSNQPIWRDGRYGNGSILSPEDVKAIENSVPYAKTPPFIPTENIPWWARADESMNA